MSSPDSIILEFEKAGGLLTTWIVLGTVGIFGIGLLPFVTRNLSLTLIVTFSFGACHPNMYSIRCFYPHRDLFTIFG